MIKENEEYFIKIESIIVKTILDLKNPQYIKLREYNENRKFVQLYF